MIIKKLAIKHKNGNFWCSEDSPEVEATVLLRRKIIRFWDNNTQGDFSFGNNPDMWQPVGTMTSFPILLPAHDKTSFPCFYKQCPDLYKYFRYQLAKKKTEAIYYKTGFHPTHFYGRLSANCINSFIKVPLDKELWEMLKDNLELVELEFSVTGSTVFGFNDLMPNSKPTLVVLNNL